METVGRRVLEERHPCPEGNTDKNFYRVGFHVPPFNTVFHLHLHIAGVPIFKPKHQVKKLGSSLRPVALVIETLKNQQ